MVEGMANSCMVEDEPVGELPFEVPWPVPGHDNDRLVVEPLLFALQHWISLS
jgi:hypothetical protein